MSSSKPSKTSDGQSLHIAKKQPNSNAFPVMPSPIKDCGSKRPFDDNEPPINAWKKSCTTLPTKRTDDPFIDDRKLPSKFSSIGEKKNANNFSHPIRKLVFRKTILLFTRNAKNVSHPIRKFAFRKTMLPLPENADNLSYPIWKFVFRKTILLLTKNAYNLFHPIQKFVFRRTILLLNKNADNLSHPIRKLAFRRLRRLILIKQL